ncbi:hypothetical protein B0A48_12489 [Cryoendolithus antarcticus]|uniref:BZIP domain-containing protein n=1 Tax=Cryoendolithus antarcticus TaxID=1507870 RepID=A0A1V8SS89_9PEZI|nr:hypothetical protein B0A48_12489 [Cryoendolithus antarcticus]
MNRHSGTTSKQAGAGGRKRSRHVKDIDSDDGGKRQGRPRVEKPDETPSDRRRTQIRLAQRAYRERKERTLDDLRKRVSELNSTIECMNTAFGSCRDKLASTGLHDEQLLDLEETRTYFTTLVKTARDPGDEVGGGDDAADLAIAPSTGVHSGKSCIPSARNVDAWVDKTLEPPEVRAHTTPWGYGSSIPTIKDYLKPALLRPEGQLRALANIEETGLEYDDLGHPLYRGEPSSTALDLELPRTYSFQETTIARRIHRACLEGAYHLLLNYTHRPHACERVFKLSFLGRSRSKLLAAMRDILKRGPKDSLDFWEAPLIHVGGAGTHYPRRDEFGNKLPMRPSKNLGIVGPQTLARMETAARDNIGVDMTVEVAGFEGEWLDPYDVQGYLEEKGIFMDPAASFADAELPQSIDSSGTMSAASSMNGTSERSDHATSGLERDRASNLNPMHLEFLREADAQSWNGQVSPNDRVASHVQGIRDADTAMHSWQDKDAADGRVSSGNTAFINPQHVNNNASRSDTMGTASSSEQLTMLNMYDATDPRMSNENYRKLAFAGMDRSAASVSPPPTKKVIIDVSKFIKTIMVCSSCLGRTAGFRRKDVDRALVVSSFEAY